MGLTREDYVILTVLIANFLIALYYLLKNKATGKRQYWLEFGVMILCPVVGMAFYFFSGLFYKVVSDMEIDLKDVVFGKERVKTQIKADEMREKNILPIEEAVLVNDRKNQRLAMMNVIKGDVSKSLSAVSLALHAKDSETAHYAASALSSILNDFRITVSKMQQKLSEEAPEETQAEEEMLDYMDKVLRQQVFSDLEQERFVNIMEQVAETLYQKDASRITPERYENTCLRLLEIKDTKLSSKWCLRQAEQYPEQLSSYSCKLKLYFMMQERENFFRVLEELKKSKVVIDSETLEIIRVFSLGRVS